MKFKEQIFKEYKLQGYLDDKKLYKEKHSDYTTGTIVKHFKLKFEISEDEFDLISEKYSDIPFIKNKFNENRKKAFNSDVIRFYDWFKEQNNCCGYCGITQDELYTIFEDKLPLNDKIKRSSGTLEIERLNSNDDYSEKNIILACPLCNNAKSNLIDENSWRDFFVDSMRKYYKKLLDELKNQNL